MFIHKNVKKILVNFYQHVKSEYFNYNNQRFYNFSLLVIWILSLKILRQSHL